MTKPIDADLVAAFKADLSAAWDRIREQYPSERLYAFGLYTTEAAESFCPFACGNDGLHRVAQEYVGKEHYSNMDEAMAGLKWSIADSPYQDKLPYQCIDAELRKRPDPTDGQLPETASAREIRAQAERGGPRNKVTGQRGSVRNRGGEARNHSADRGRGSHRRIRAEVGQETELARRFPSIRVALR